tara:strand:- start:265 stop:594 length:330 start_codon:yes stop_codon:yes gene_type:complete
MMRFIIRMSWLALLVITGIMLSGFVTSNQQLISIRFWPTRAIMQAETWVFILATFGLGTITGATIFWFQNLSLKARLWSKAKQISELKAQIEETEQLVDDKRISGDYGK